MSKLFDQQSAKIPPRMYFAAGGIFVAAFFGWMRFALSINNWGLFQTLGVTPGVWYLAANGLLSGLVYTVAGIMALFPNEKWKKPVFVLLLSGLTLFWIDRICFAHSQEAQIAIPFSLVASAGLTIFALCFLFWNTISRYLKKWKD
jgi:hypothetical protein